MIAAFVVGRLAKNPGVPVLAAWEGTMTVWACWIALYSAVRHGHSKRRAGLVVAVLSAVLFGEVVREIFFYEGGVYTNLPLNEAFLLAYNVVSIALPVVLGVAVRSLRERERRAGRADDGAAARA